MKSHDYLAALVERDRRALENEALRAARRVVAVARSHAIAAARVQADIAAAVATVMAADDDDNGLFLLLLVAAFGAYESGVRRAWTFLAWRTGRPVHAAVAEAAEALSVMRPQDARSIRAAILAAVRQFVMGLADAIANNVAAARAEMAESTAGAAPPASVPPTAIAAALIRAAKAALESMGIGPMGAVSGKLETAIVTEILRAYGRGMFRGLMAAAERGEVKAFRHVSILDERTTPICGNAHGVTLAPDDPYWLNHWPPLHWNCRSIIAPILGDWTPVFPRHAVSPATGFGGAVPF